MMAAEAVTIDEMELGMPHLGAHGLSESQMLRHLGHLRWAAFGRSTGVPIRVIVDGRGRRLYATFYHVQIDFPLSAPPQSFGEGDRVVWVGALAACGRNILDGHFALFRAGDSRVQRWGAPNPDTRAQFLEGGVPVVRLSNIFIAQEGGAETLSIGQPVNADLSVLETCEPPEGYALNRRAEASGSFFDAPEGAVPAARPEVDIEYVIDADRDVNGVGLLYFANFPAFFDVAERGALDGMPEGGLPRALTDRRATVRRRIGFFGNARADDRLCMRATCAIVPEPLRVATERYGRIWSTVRVHRRSDGRLIAITTADRICSLAEGRDEIWTAYASRLQ